MKRTKQLILVYGCLFLMCSCVKQENLYEEPPIKGGEEYANQFKNSSDIKVSINSQYEGTFYSIYYGNPYEEGSLVKEAYLEGKTPISTSLKVPNDVEILYIIGNGKQIECPVKDITIDDNTPSTRGTTITDAVLNAINSKYFPEKYNNIKDKDLYKCTDLKIAESESTGEFEKAEVWITYLSDGGFANSNQYGKLWFYTYPSDKRETLTVDDCTFYGKNSQGKIISIDYNTHININDANSTNNHLPIFYSKDENAKAKIGDYTKITLGTFAKDLNIGFVFHGPNERPQFTTPSLNLSETNNKFIAKDYNYKGKTITYKADNTTFKIEKNISNGFIYHIKEGNFEGNVLGMENRTPGYSAYDGDYNDMLCLIESNPIAIEPIDTITPPNQEETYTIEKGYYLFEDNYPQQGDFDFNDVVIEYSIKTSTEKGNESKTVTAKLLAKGCAFTNEFGFKDNNGYTPFFTGIYGKENIVGTINETGVTDRNGNTTVTKVLVGTIKPYLHNGKAYIFEDVYNTDAYPYVLDIPISDSSISFRWCQESKQISDAYSFDAPRAKNWYMQPKNENLIIKWK